MPTASVTAWSDPLAAAKGAAAVRCLQSRALSRSLELPVLGGNRVDVLLGAAAGAALSRAFDQAISRTRC